MVCHTLSGIAVEVKIWLCAPKVQQSQSTNVVSSCFIFTCYINATVSPAITMLTIDISLIRMLSDGPLVSLKGSPTVSPTIQALWANEPLPPKAPSSIFFLALSQAPPALAMNTAKVKPPASPPTSSPSTPATPSTQPTMIGIRMARTDGITISC